jgi:FkbM family methyltransferase
MIREYLIDLMNKGFVPSQILDIGANVGNFTRMCKSIWPLSKCIMIEGNGNCSFNLSMIGDPFFIALLGDEDGKKVKFYQSRISNTATGNSIYRENTNAYNEENIIILEESLITLNTLLKDLNFHPQFAKLDTQGSELDILKGGDNILKDCKYILLEVSLKYYNEGIPLKDEVLNFMKEYGYNNYKVIEDHIALSNEMGEIKKGDIFQQDIIFIKNV